MYDFNGLFDMLMGFYRTVCSLTFLLMIVEPIWRYKRETNTAAPIINYIIQQSTPNQEIQSLPTANRIKDYSSLLK